MEWKEVTLGKIAIFKTGKLNSNAAISNGEYPFFTCSPETLRINSYAFDQEAILLAGNNAEGNFSIKYYKGKFNAYQRTYVITPIRGKVDIKFLYYALSLCLKQLKNMSQGTSTKFLTVTILNSFSVKLPSISNQRRIASILSSLDRKIELNNKINADLEEMAQAIFKNWFVDFEPFKDGKFVDSELGMIPEGWKVGRLDEIADIVGGSTPSKAKPEYYTQKGIAWLTPKDLSNHPAVYTSRGEIDITEEGYNSTSTKLMPKGTILFTSRAPIGYISIAQNDICTNQGFKSLVPKKAGTCFLYCFLKYVTPVIENKSTGSTFKEASGSLMKSLQVIMPEQKVFEDFETIVSPLFARIESLEKENSRLSLLRDTLLPRLMSGELEVPE
jgi:type I restriction enzyme S subunit